MHQKNALGGREGLSGDKGALAQSLGRSSLGMSLSPCFALSGRGESNTFCL